MERTTHRRAARSEAEGAAPVGSLGRARRLASGRRSALLGLGLWGLGGLSGCGPQPPRPTAVHSAPDKAQRAQGPLPAGGEGGRWHRVQPNESLWLIAQRSSVDLQDLIELNGLARPDHLEVGQLIFVPTPQAAASPTRAASEGAEIAWQWPLQRGRVSSRFGYRARFGRAHKGLDIAAPRGTPIYAAAAGTVTYSDRKMRGYGNAVMIDHGGGWVSLYAHCQENLVRVGQRVEQGALIARVGNTGHSTGPHLHFEIRHDAKHLDPEKLLPQGPFSSKEAAVSALDDAPP